MAKKRQTQNEPKSAAAPMAVLVAGGIAVLALVGWAVTRSMQAPTTVATPTSTLESPAPVDTSALPPPVTATNTVSMPPVSTLPPAATNTFQQEGDKAAAARIEAADLKQQLAAGAVTVIDVRDMASFDAGHITGAKHIPLARIEGEVQYLPKDKPIVTYCT
jgi:hypothetical protein